MSHSTLLNENSWSGKFNNYIPDSSFSLSDYNGDLSLAIQLHYDLNKDEEFQLAITNRRNLEAVRIQKEKEESDAEKVRMSKDNKPNHIQAFKPLSMNTKAETLVNCLLATVSKQNLRFKPNTTKKFEPFLLEQMIPFAERFINVIERFREKGYSTSDLRVDIGYHYTTPSNMDLIKNVGLLTPAERKEYCIDPSEPKGSWYGDGIYTCNNPFAFILYGEVGLVVARVLGKIKMSCNSKPHDSSSSSATSSLQSTAAKKSLRFPCKIVPEESMAEHEQDYDTIRGNKMFLDLKAKSLAASTQSVANGKKHSYFGRLISRQKIDCHGSHQKVCGGQNISRKTIATNTLDPKIAFMPVNSCATSFSNMCDIDMEELKPSQTQIIWMQEHPIDYWNEDVLQSSAQCLPIVHYNRYLILTSSNGSQTQLFHNERIKTMHDELQKTLDEFVEEEYKDDLFFM